MDNRIARVNLLRYSCVIILSTFAIILYTVTRRETFLFSLIPLLFVLTVVDYLICRKMEEKLYMGITNGETKDHGAQDEIRQYKSGLFGLQSCATKNEISSLINTIAKIKDELRMKEQELQVLREASEIITSTMDADCIIEYLYSVYNRFSGCDRCFICLVDNATGDLVCKYEFGQVTFHEVGMVYDDATSVKSCFRKAETLVKINELIRNRGCYGDKVLIPLHMMDKLIGVIFLESGIPGTFANINIKFIESISAYTAIAIHNAEMFKDLYSQKQEIESLYEQTAAANEQLNAYIRELNLTKEELNKKNKELSRYNDEIHTGYLQTVTALANSIQAKDAYTMGHCQRVMEIACQIAAIMGCSENEKEELRYSAILHDIGKIGIPATILNKRDKLTDVEYEEIKKHPLISYSILKDVEFIKGGLVAILQHHERFDGKGYPYGIKGEEICLAARILCVADAFDAMTSDRPYRKAMPTEAAVKEIVKCKGTQFDPAVVDSFLRSAVARV